MSYTDLWEVLISDVNPHKKQDTVRDLCTWRGRKVVDLKKNVDKNPLYNPIDGKGLPVYVRPSDDHHQIRTASRSCILVQSGPTSESKAKELNDDYLKI
jgi:hypothetical protein